MDSFKTSTSRVCSYHVILLMLRILLCIWKKRGQTVKSFSSASSLVFPNLAVNLEPMTLGYQTRISAATDGLSAEHRCCVVAWLCWALPACVVSGFYPTSLLLSLVSATDLCVCVRVLPHGESWLCV